MFDISCVMFDCVVCGWKEKKRALRGSDLNRFVETDKNGERGKESDLKGEDICLCDCVC